MNQADIISFLSSPAALGLGEVEVVGTHCALVFLAGDVALKLKRNVHYDYVDQSTPELRHALLRRELQLNAPTAPAIYRDVLPVTRGPQGLALGGEGEPVDWVLRMRRFPAADQLDEVVTRGGFTDALAAETGRVIAAYHAAAPVIRREGARLIGDILDELARVFAGFPEAAAAGTGPWLDAARRELERLAPLLDRRGREGHVRRAHGDLHLRNMVLIDRHPVPFDALEFSEELGTCDVLYDTAFLVMDLGHRGLWRQAGRVLEAWLGAAGGAEDAGMAALPLFLSVRAAIRAMVLLQTDAAEKTPNASAPEVAVHMGLARSALQPAPPRLVAVGGYSGSGKSVLAAALTAEFGALPGAIWLSSDAERKAAQASAAALPEAQYSARHRHEIYRRLFHRAGVLLAAGQSVLLDATFLDPGLRDEAAAVAREAAAPFTGLWLDAPPAMLLKRVAARKDSLSDADETVLRRQLAIPVDPAGWLRLDASGSRDNIFTQAREALRVGQTLQ